jgi:hypothetical protein
MVHYSIRYAFRAKNAYGSPSGKIAFVWTAGRLQYSLMRFHSAW